MYHNFSQDGWMQGHQFLLRSGGMGLKARIPKQGLTEKMIEGEGGTLFFRKSIVVGRIFLKGLELPGTYSFVLSHDPCK